MTSASSLTTDPPTTHDPSERSDRQRWVIQKARELFAEQGYAATSLREVARASDVTHAGVLRMFGSKAELLLAVLDEHDHADFDRYGRDLESGRAGLLTIFEVLRDNARDPQLARFYTRMATEALDPSHPAHQYFVRRYRGGRAVLRGFLEAMKARGELRDHANPTVLAALVVGTMDGMQLQSQLEPSSLSPSEYLAAMLNPFLVSPILPGEVLAIGAAPH